MFGLRLDFDSPIYLTLLALLPLMWWISFRRLQSLGATRRWFAIAFRTAVVTAIVMAIAGVQVVWQTDRVTVLYLLDQSESIPEEKRAQMLEYAIENVRLHRDATREDRVGLIVFGAEAAIEIPPFADDLPATNRLDGLPGRTDATNLESALQLAKAVMPEDSRRRIVLISDGNQTTGDAATAIARLAQSGIGIDVMPVSIGKNADVLVEKIDLPTDIRRGQTFEARVVVNNFVQGERADPVVGRLNVTRQVGGEEQLLLDQQIELTPGKNVFPLTHRIDEAAPYTYTAKFIPDSADDDAITGNNTTTAYTYVRGQGRVLFIEPANSSGGYQLLVDQLRKADIEVTIQDTNSLFGSLAELQAYDAVILAGVARTSGDSVESISAFTDDQIEMLVRNTQQLGCGLLMIGGPDAFGAGGWAGTKLEEAMPVDFEIKNLKVAAVGALQLVIDSSGSMQGEKMTLCKAAAIQAVKALQPTDMIGVIAFDSEAREVVPMQKVAGRSHIAPRIARITADGGTDLFPAMEKGFFSLRKAEASTKHMIVLTDGQTPPNSFRELVTRMQQDGITVSGVAVGPDADVNLMRQIASIGGGKVYHVLSPKAIPKILMREARRVSRGLIHEDSAGFSPEITFPHTVLSGLESSPPLLNGYVMTTPKSNPLVQTVMTSPVPAGQENPLLSVWQYGLGRSAVLTTDAGQRWATSWVSWPGYEKLFEQLVRWLMRPTGDTGKFDIATRFRDGEVQVVVNALDQSDEFLNFLPMNASVLDPNMKPIPMQMRQTAPGRYVGTFLADSPGNFFVNVVPQAGTAPLTTGVSVPYSDEYRLRELNEPLLTSLAATKPRGGSAGEMLSPLGAEVLRLAQQANPFRVGLASDRSIRDVWPWAVLIACCLFLADIFTRRVAVSLGWIKTAWKAMVGAAPEPVPAIERLDTLRVAKESVAKSRETASARYEPTLSPTSPAIASRDLQTATASGDKPRGMSSDESASAKKADFQPDSQSYTERLLAAKRNAKR